MSDNILQFPGCGPMKDDGNKRNLGGGSPPTSIETRLTRLEIKVDHIESEIGEIKTDMREICNDIKIINRTTIPKIHTTLTWMPFKTASWIVGLITALGVLVKIGQHIGLLQ